MSTHKKKPLTKFKCNLITWLTVKFPKVLLIFVIGFTTRFIINDYLGVNVFVDYKSLISIFYYLNFSWFIVYINSIDFNGIYFNINRLKLIHWDNFTYKNILSAIRCMIDGIINSNDINKITMDWEGVSPLDNHSKMQASPLDNHSKMQASPMNVNELAATPGSSPALILGAPDIKPDGKYDTPPMVYTPGGNNQPYGRILAKALEDHAIRKNHTDSNGNASTLQWQTYIFDDDANKFLEDFFKDKYPNRIRSKWLNSTPVRRELANL